MRDNFNTCFVGSRAVLVPYLKEHVDKYHEWMKDSYILEMTASEPLTIEEEYEMQQSWRDDQKKCTFIILSKNNLDTSNAILTSSNSTDKLGESMAGDVNLYINDYYDGNRAEIEVMIAEKSHRRKGLAKEALQMMMLFGVRNLQLSCFYAKINKDNSDSIALFKSLQYEEINYVEAFGEYEYEFKVTQTRREELEKICAGILELKYTESEEN